MVAPYPAAPPDPRLPRGWWPTALVVALGVIYLGLQLLVVRPYLPPAGHGARLAGDSTLAGAGENRLLVARPPAIDQQQTGAPAVVSVALRSPAQRAGLEPGDRVRSLRNQRNGRLLNLAAADFTDPATRMRLWREAYWMGLRDPLTLEIETAGSVRTVQLTRPPVWELDHRDALAWARQHVGLLIQVSAFIVAGAVLLALRPRDATAQFTIAALVLSAAAAAGPPMGAEGVLPAGLAGALTVFSWLAAPLAFPTITLGILHFPQRSPIVGRHRWILPVPFVVSAPMIVAGLLTGLFVAGVSALAPAAAWDATHPEVFFTAFAAALGVNIGALGEGIRRFKRNADQQERRRVLLAVVTLALATAAYTVKDGIPAVMLASTGLTIDYPWWLEFALYLLVALPAAGVTYAVAVHRVLAPRVVVRRSLQYALARKTLALAAVLPAALLVLSLIRQRDRSLADIVTGAPLFYLALLAALVAAIRFREPARLWLDRRFFRAEYDARAVLVSLAGRIPYETDPDELTAMVVSQIDAALHPSMVMVLVSGLDSGVLTPVAVLHGNAAPLADAGALATMLRWSDEPLDLDLEAPRSPARRLPPDEIAWLASTQATLLVPLLAREGASGRLLGAIALGERRSEEPYSQEDRDLLASIAAQVALGLDVARLRRRDRRADGATDVLTVTGTPLPLAAECPTCGHCDDPGTGSCPEDRMPMRLGALPRVVDDKYRVDRRLGRGGMGAVYRARDMRLDRDVALKVIRADRLGQPEARARFRREAQLVARLQHPGIVAVHDYGTLPDGGAFLVMEFVRGRDLRAVLRAEGRLAAGRAVPLLRAVAEPVEAAHRAGILHRDLKPENILLPDGDVGAKVVDFGIAKAFGDETGGDETLTMAGQPVGTPAYMAPEQLAGDTLSARTDVFALGVIAFELLTGDVPFGRGSLLDIATRQRQGWDFAADTLLPRGLGAVIGRALAWNPTERTESAAAFADELRRAGI